MSYEMLLINPNYAQELTIHNRTLVGFVIDDKNKIVNQCFVKREALPDWFESRRATYSVISHRFIIGAVSISGELIDSQEYKGPLSKESFVSH